MYNITHGEIIDKCKNYVFGREKGKATYDETDLSIVVVYSCENKSKSKVIMESNYSGCLYKAIVDKNKDVIYMRAYNEIECNKICLDKGE